MSIIKSLSRRSFLKLICDILGSLFSRAYHGIVNPLVVPISTEREHNDYHIANPNLEIFLDDFEDTAFSEACWSPRSNYTFTSGKTGQGICIENVSGDTLIGAPIPVGGIKGNVVALAANVRAENISQKPQPWNGVKIVLEVELNDGTSTCAQPLVEAGTFDWANKGVLAAIPTTAVAATLRLGIESCSGNVWFDDVLVKVVRTPASFPPPRDPDIPINKHHDLSALRGAMVSTYIQQADLQVLGQEWGANVIRWQLGETRYPEGLLTPDYDAILEEELTLLDNALPWCEQYGMWVLVNLHSLSARCFESVEVQEKLVEVWRAIATRYKDSDVVWAYDIVNEPRLEGAWGEGVLLWEELAEQVAYEIRAVDPEKPIVVESLDYAHPGTFSYLRPLDFSIQNVVYSPHMYLPHAFTHQTLTGSDQTFVYPGMINGQMWDKNQLVEALQSAREFQQKYRVPILIGEFSAIRWAPSNSAFYYLEDCIEIFESHGWDWCYHAFREWHGWSVEHSEDRDDLEPTPVPNDRQQLLRLYFGQNLNPYEHSEIYLPLVLR